MPIEDLARTDPVTAGPDTAVADLAATMDDESVGSVVITNDETPVGIVTDRDLAVRVLAERVDPDGLTASDVMSRNLVIADPDTGFYEAASFMAERAVRRLPVCDNETLVGIITADDMIELLGDEQQHLGDIIRSQRPNY